MRPIILTLLLTTAAWAQAPLTLTYQGTLADAAGAAVAGLRPITFRLYHQPGDPEDPGDPIWTEAHPEVPIEPDGSFTMQLIVRFEGERR